LCEVSWWFFTLEAGLRAACGEFFAFEGANIRSGFPRV
jgi:hypothetical protein